MPNPNIKKYKIIALDFDGVIANEEATIKKKWVIVLNSFKYLHPNLNKVFFYFYEKYPRQKVLNRVFEKLKIKKSYKKKILQKFHKQKIKEVFFKKIKKLFFLLKKNSLVGVMTNGKKKYQLPRLKQLSFFKKIDFIYYGDKFQKPKKFFFFQCNELKRLTNLNEFLYIGNEYEKDIKPCIKLNMNAFLISQHKKYKNLTFRDIEGLISFLDKNKYLKN